MILDDALHYLKARGLAGYHITLEGLAEKNASPIGSDHGSSPSIGESSDTSLGSQGEVEPGPKDYFQSSIGKRAPKLVVVSSHEQGGIDRIRKQLTKYLGSKLDDHDDIALLKTLAYTMAQRRSRLPWKTFAIASSAKELWSTLASEPLIKAIRSSQVPKLGFVFTGQGAQWHAMGRELSSHRVFRQSLADADAFLKSLKCQWSLTGKLPRPPNAGA